MGPAPARAPRHRCAGATNVARLAILALLVGGSAACSPDSSDAGSQEADAAVSLTAPDEASPTPSSEPLVTATPDAYSEVGDLVAGFPIELLPVPSDAVILVTSAVPVGDADVQEVSLNLRTAATAEALLELYRDALTSAGFTEVTAETSGSDLAAEVTFVRSGGDEVVSIGVLDVDGGRTVTIGGRVRTTD